MTRWVTPDTAAAEAAAVLAAGREVCSVAGSSPDGAGVLRGLGGEVVVSSTAARRPSSSRPLNRAKRGVDRQFLRIFEVEDNRLGCSGVDRVWRP